MAEETDFYDIVVLGFGKMRSEFRAVSVLLGRGDCRLDFGFDADHVMEQFFDLAGFPSELRIVVEVLVLAAAALTENGARRFDSVGRCFEDFDEVGFGEILVVAIDAGSDAFAR